MYTLPFTLTRCPACAKEIRGHAKYDFKVDAGNMTEDLPVPEQLPGETVLIGVVINEHSCVPPKTPAQAVAKATSNVRGGCFS